MAPPRSDSIHQDGGALLSVPFDPAFDGDFPSFKFLVMLLDRGSGRLREAVEALRVEDEGLMKGLSALHVAAGRGNLDMCRYLVEDLGVDVNVVDGEGRTPLFWTVLSKNVGAANYLLDHGANQDKANHDGFSPLHQAVESGDAEMVELLLAKGAYFDPVASCETPLHFAATQWQDRTMKILLEHSSDKSRRLAPIHEELEAKKLCVVNRQTVYSSHMTGKNHKANEHLEAKRRRMLDAGAAQGEVRVCRLCNVVVNSNAVYSAHKTGKKHKANVFKQQQVQRRKIARDEKRI
uniref:Uncharacterized protein n=1 Tax=Avena sativa TaxID=4498 RepID=A0ACD5TDC6_AVESA